MITKPKAKKFRIRRSAPLSGAPRPAATVRATPTLASGGAAARVQQPDPDMMFAPVSDGFGDEPFPTAMNANIAAPAQVSSEDAIDAIRREGLTGRQLRMARRVAQKHGLAPTSDFDAVRLLRAKDIDPFERAAMLELVVADGQPAKRTGTEMATGNAQLPQTVAPPQLPSTQVMSEDARAREVWRIQQDIARRRRRKLAMLLTRLAFFVFLPTVIAGYYYYNIATPMYETRSEFLIQKADAPAGGALGSLFSGTQFATSQDSITVQSFLQSRDAMLRLDREVGFKKHFSQDWIDPIKRLPPDGSNEAAYALYRKDVKIGYDPSEGIIKMSVIAADPDTSRRFSEALIRYAEEQVDHLSQRLREDQMQGAHDSFDDADAKMQAAQARVLELQEKLGVLNPESETASMMSQITGFQVELQKKRLELQQLLDNTAPSKARVDGAKGDIQRLETLVGGLRSQMTTSGDSTASLAKISGELRMAEVDLQTRQLMMQQALQQLETARIEANKQVRYISMGVKPVAPDQPTYPRKFEDTLLAFLIFSGIYLMLSLTASILREQVSA